MAARKHHRWHVARARWRTRRRAELLAEHRIRFEREWFRQMMFEDAPLDGLKPGKIQGILAYTSERPPIRDYDMEAINGLGFHFTDRQRAVYEEIDRIIRGVRDEPPRIIIESTARGMGDYFERVMEQYLVEMPFNPWHRFNIGGEA